MTKKSPLSPKKILLAPDSFKGSLTAGAFCRTVEKEAAARFGRIVYIDEPLGTYRQHGENAVGAKHVGSVGYRRDRLGKLEEVRETIRRKKEQAACFREIYRDKLTGEDVLFLEGFEKEKSGIGFYLKYGGLIHGAERKLGFALLG